MPEFSEADAGAGAGVDGDAEPDAVAASALADSPDAAPAAGNTSPSKLELPNLGGGIS